MYLGIHMKSDIHSWNICVEIEGNGWFFFSVHIGRGDFFFNAKFLKGQGDSAALQYCAVQYGSHLPDVTI